MSTQIRFKRITDGILAFRGNKPVATISPAQSGIRGCHDVKWVSGRIDRDLLMSEAKDTCLKA